MQKLYKSVITWPFDKAILEYKKEKSMSGKMKILYQSGTLGYQQ